MSTGGMTPALASSASMSTRPTRPLKPRVKLAASLGLPGVKIVISVPCRAQHTGAALCTPELMEYQQRTARGSCPHVLRQQVHSSPICCTSTDDLGSPGLRSKHDDALLCTAMITPTVTRMGHLRSHLVVFDNDHTIFPFPCSPKDAITLLNPPSPPSQQVCCAPHAQNK